MTPQPGDVIILKDNQRAVIDGSHFGLDFEDGRGPVVLAVIGASAYRYEDHVSCSGGPAPFVAISQLREDGKVHQKFWRFKNNQWRAHNGEDYIMEVTRWRQE